MGYVRNRPQKQFSISQPILKKLGDYSREIGAAESRVMEAALRAFFAIENEADRERFVASAFVRRRKSPSGRDKNEGQATLDLSNVPDMQLDGQGTRRKKRGA